MITLGRNAALKSGLCALLAVIVFVLDLLIPLGAAVIIAYVGVILFTAWLPQRYATTTVALACTGLTLLGFALSPAGGEPWKVFANRSLVILAIWVTAAVLIKRKQSEQDLQESIARFQDVLATAPEAIISVGEAQGNPWTEKERRGLSRRSLHFQGVGGWSVDLYGCSS